MQILEAARKLPRSYEEAASGWIFAFLHEVIPRLWLYCVIRGVHFFSYVQWDALICVDADFA